MWTTLPLGLHRARFCEGTKCVFTWRYLILKKHRFSCVRFCSTSLGNEAYLISITARTEKIDKSFQPWMFFLKKRCTSMTQLFTFNQFSGIYISKFIRTRSTSVVIGILLQSSAWYNRIKQRWPQLVLVWVTEVVCQFLVIVLWMRLYIEVLGAALAMTVCISPWYW